MSKYKEGTNTDKFSSGDTVILDYDVVLISVASPPPPPVYGRLIDWKDAGWGPVWAVQTEYRGIPTQWHELNFIALTPYERLVRKVLELE